MQIAMISYWSCPLTTLGIGTAGGMNVYVLNLAQALGELGHSVDIYTVTHTEEDDSEASLHPNVTVLHLSPQSITCSSDPYADIDHFAGQIKTIARSRNQQYDVLHAHYYYSGLAGLALRRHLKTPLLMTFHTLGTMKKQYLGIEDRRRIEAESAI